MRKLDPFHQRESCTLLLPRYEDRHANLMSIGDGKQYVQVNYIMSASMALHGLCRGFRFIWHRPNGVHRCPADSGHKRRDHQFLRIARDSCGSLCWRIRLRHWVVPLKCKYGEAPPARGYAKINTTFADAKFNAKQFPALLPLQLSLSRAL